jgi:hypothetical protein
LSTYRMPLEELQQNFNGFKKINEGMWWKKQNTEYYY